MKVILEVLDELSIRVWNDGAEGVIVDIIDSEWEKTEGETDKMGVCLSVSETDMLIATLEWAKRETIHGIEEQDDERL